MKQITKPSIPRYYLYGDQVDDVELDFLHIEPIRERSGQHDWTIRAHAHPDHVQILLIESGGGSIRIEEHTFEISVQSIVVIPAAMVHEINFERGTDGTVITAASAYATSATHGDMRLLEVLATPQVYPLAGSGVNIEAVTDAFNWANREYIWSAPGRRMAILAQFLRILVALMRLRSARESAGFTVSDRDYEILCRYRELLEQNFRGQRGLEFYAKEIGISAQRLNLACKARTGRTSSEILRERMIIEAKRYLIYTEMTVAEVGYELGFEDPAYFSRFFSQRVGQPPGAYREQNQVPTEQRDPVPAE
ncbi:helix-turn-helix domain-containing protein [Roseibium aggregatum]|uniref:Helix-turn-helix domain-containing protein n=1 Tax=Roseibium aggregatum TaxID=187304 RepID=A0A926P427_9HYPH|nr:helix-turn-helix domain-containing protein [Roseibium aggregatum]MBD1549393.1 helix-turn-helix domain-containing protein [Roseibium aggregatum]